MFIVPEASYKSFAKLQGIITSLFTKGSHRTVEAKKNILLSFLYRGITIIINLVLVPLTIGYINPERYGIWITLSSVVLWFSFFDIGLSNGLRNKFAEAKAKGETGLVQAYVSTTYFILSLIFLSIWVLFLVFNRFIDWSALLNTGKEMKDELNSLALIVITYFCFQIILKTISIVLTADQMPAKSSLIDLLGNSLTLFIIYLLTRFTHGSLIYLGLTMGGAPLIILLLFNLTLFRGKYYLYRPKLSCVNLRECKTIMSLGIRFFIVQIAALVIYQTNNIVIAQILGPEEVTVYNIAYKYFGILSMVFMIILNPFWTAFTDAYTKNDTGWMERSLKKIEKAWLLLAIAGIMMLAVSGKIYSIWIGNKVIVPFVLSASMLIYYLVFTRLSLYIYLLNGIGKIKLQLIVNIILAVLNIPVIIFLGYRIGLAGIVLGNILISAPHLFYSPLQLSKIIKNEAKGIWMK
jgi:O-antigen/teichoic acid export membrane protein